ncbi:MAG TPA: FtsX-like permease family protein [Arsenicitalea sp.]|jgi:putative ABC transport system permease protein|nr:FtsX-like permease family protein [Arsenicitalea sp.]
MNRVAGWLRIAAIDLRGDFRRFGVLLVCLALGVGTIAAVGSVGAALQSAINRDAKLFLGGDLEARLSYRAAEPAELSFFRTLGTVSEVDELNARATAGDNAAFLTLRAIDNAYPLVGSIKMHPGGEGKPALAAALKSVDGAYGAIVDPLLLERLNIKLGDSFSIGAAKFQARDILDALPDQAAVGFQLGVPVVISSEGLAASKIIQPGVLARYRYKILLNNGDFEKSAAAIKTAFPKAGWETRAPKDAAANFARFFDLFGRFLILVGLSSLLIGGVGVSNAVSAYITERQRSIATMRSLGATGARLMVHFLFQVMVLALVATVLGLVLGALCSALALPFLGNLLSLDLPPTVHLPSLLTATGFGLLIAFAFAFLPLTRAQRLRPASLFRSVGAGLVEGGLGWRDLRRWQMLLPLALAVAAILGLAMLTTAEPMLVVWYAAGAVAAFVLLRLAAWLLQRALRLVPPLPSPNARQALKAINRPGAPTPTVVLSLGLGLSLLLLIALVESNLRGQLNGQITEDAPSFVLMNMQKDEVAALATLTKTDPQIEKLTSAPMLRGIVSKINNTDVDKLKIAPGPGSFLLRGDQGLTWSAELPPGQSVAQGKWWAPDYSGPPLLSLDRDLEAPLNLKVGDTMEITISGRPITATIANFRDIDIRTPALSFALMFSPGMIEAAPATYIGSIKARPGAEGELQQTLVHDFPSLAFAPVGDALNRLAALLGSLANAVTIVGGLAVISGVFVVAGALAAGRQQREADAVVMKVLGATRGDVTRAYLVEYGLLGALATLLAALLGSTAAWAIVTNVLKLPFSLDFGLLVIVLLGAMAVTMLTGLVTTWTALSTRPAQFLRAE